MTEQEMMENWMRNATPGPQHAKLAKGCGEYEVNMIERGQPMAGKAKLEMILDGRVQVQHFNMDYNGMPFTGFGMTGFDNFSQRYWFTWNDNMSTGMFSMWGVEKDGGNKVVFDGKMDSPGMNLKDVPCRHAYTFINDNEFKYEAWNYPDTPQEAKMMEMHYKRRM
ncbi:MAG: DUF1579 family protein [bacterium]|nr:DUF1579 family protein [bacterium]